MRDKVRNDTFCKITISIIAVILIVFLPNYDHLIYKSMKVVSSKMMKEDGNIYNGYPAGEGINSVESLGDLDLNRSFTIEVSNEDIVETGYYVEYLYYIDGYYHIEGIRKYIDRIFRNIENEKLAQFCVVTLASGEKCFVLIDTNLINLNSSKTIKLPIGEKETNTFDFFSQIASREGISSEECKYFIDTTYESYDVETKLQLLYEIKGWATFIIFIITYIIFTKVFKKLGYETEIEMIRNFVNQMKDI